MNKQLFHYCKYHNKKHYQKRNIFSTSHVFSEVVQISQSSLISVLSSQCTKSFLANMLFRIDNNQNTFSGLKMWSLSENLNEIYPNFSWRLIPKTNKNCQYVIHAAHKRAQVLQYQLQISFKGLFTKGTLCCAKDLSHLHSVIQSMEWIKSNLLKSIIYSDPINTMTSYCYILSQTAHDVITSVR